MALTPRLEKSQGFVQVAAGGTDKSTDVSQTFVQSIAGGTDKSIDLSQSYVQAVVNFPTKQLVTSQHTVQALLAGTDKSVDLTQLYITAVVKGRVDDPKIRAWTYTLDGHDFYILRLGSTSETLVCDVTTGQWFVWGSAETNLWRAYNGTNWISSSNILNGENFDTNVVVGDDGNGALYFLSHTQFSDDDALDGANTLRPYTREFQGQIVKRGYDSETVFAIELLGSIGEMDQPDLTDVTLEYSDDDGETYINAGTITIPNGDEEARVTWRSLGSFSAPGRMFKLTDTGALQRIDSLTIETNKER